MGVQHTDDEILRNINRECTTAQTIKAIRLLKQNCFKVDIHLMPDLPGSSPQIDAAMFRRVLNDPDLQADQWKIYPTAVTPFTKIKEWYDAGLYKPYAEIDGGKHLVKVLKTVMTQVHPWIRLNRVIRDIPVQNNTTCKVGVIGGNKIPNLRQLINDEMKEDGSTSQDIRYREVKGGKFSWNNSVTLVREYKASRGQEFFISVESFDKSTIYGFLRLRFNGEHVDQFELLECFQHKISKNGKILVRSEDMALIRELHVYGNVVAHNVQLESVSGKVHSQHLGIGKALLHKAQVISYNRVARLEIVISGIGVRGYYRKRGFNVTNEYGYLEHSLDSTLSRTYIRILYFMLFFCILCYFLLFKFFCLKIFVFNK